MFRTIKERLVRFSLLLVASIPATAVADPQITTFSGFELLSQLNVSFPDGTPTVAGSSLILGPANAPLGIMIRVGYPAGGNYPEASPASAVVIWDLIRLPCDESRGCDGGSLPPSLDHDPNFFIEQDGKAYIWQMSDNDGAYTVGARRTNSTTAGPLLDSTVKSVNSGYFPQVNQQYRVALGFAFHADHIASSIHVSIAGGPEYSLEHHFFTFGAFDPSRPYSLGILNENNAGERYLLQSAGIAAVPEPSVAATLSCGLLVLVGLTRARCSRKAGATGRR